MKLNQLFKLAIQGGIEADPRSMDDIKKSLKRVEARHKRLEGKEKEHLDEEEKWNPYLDSRILYGTGEENIKNIMVGIDIDTSELLLANELKKQGLEIDAVLAHHPSGRALADLEKVMPVQIDVVAQCGVPVNQAEGMLRPSMDRIWRSIHANNHFRTIQAAALLRTPLFCCHTAADNLVWRFMEKNICGKTFDRLEDVINAITDIPEYKHYARMGNPPILVNGGKEARTGKIFATEFTGGTNGPEDLMKIQASAGVGTVLSMHVTEKTLEVAKEHHVNMIQCSHIASDSLGMNLMLDNWQKKKANLKILPCSGFVRVERDKNKTGKVTSW
ncbi:NGG1p interacting factor NIF3 [Candidatus Peribacteria bacterium]|jgi:putative NIF3 family GTP cyclohydrolase 1 type 2|nr:NGG1p interacting factor NIF3 [Candidatus Peribacteria bacterium]MBT4473990.1 NGG1p interacting factor NIF3 [Candidatus Peribacteria bacterium]